MQGYQTKKEQARQIATNWQLDFCNYNYSYLEMFDFQSLFEKLGKRYGLTQEFRKNGII